MLIDSTGLAVMSGAKMARYFQLTDESLPNIVKNFGEWQSPTYGESSVHAIWCCVTGPFLAKLRRSELVVGVLAQLVERLVRNEKVRSSSLLGSTNHHLDVSCSFRNLFPRSVQSLESFPRWRKRLIPNPTSKIVCVPMTTTIKL
jgi:hypothetical protein